MFKDKVYIILSEFEEKIRPANEIFEQCVNEKLENALDYYYISLTETTKYLLSKNPLTVLRGLINEFGKEHNKNGTT